ncbi:hypothetical protein [Frankia sp. AgKG'84/4]|uniref:hypothetical protein n=1 Tax=Frankia sp. AgKG'84/4 TaxID=573490 RepID=UPI00201060DE|nr:hypothetical protein [Frankia sp. AgKG'84/4]MCL9795351.1 hypothetical protein [Frankia sp. AgKG'84/4]
MLVILAVNGLVRLVLAAVEVDFPRVLLPGWVGGTVDALRPVRFALVAVLLLAAAYGEYARHRRTPDRMPDKRPPAVPPAPAGDDQADGAVPR